MIQGASPVGVVSSEFEGNQSLFDTLVHGCSYCPDGYKVIKGSKQQYGDRFEEGDRIQVEIELMSGQVNFFKNEIDQGIAYFLPQGISAFPLVSLATKNDMVASQHLFMDHPRGVATTLSPCKRRLTKDRTGWDDGICRVAGTYTLGIAAADNLPSVSWHFMVEIGTRVTIGIIKCNHRGTEQKNIANEEYAWCLCQDGKKYHNGVTAGYTDPLPFTYNMVVMELDLVARTLRFYANGKDLGVAYSDLPDGMMVNAAVSLFNKNDSIYLLHPHRSVSIAKGPAILPVKPWGLGLRCQRMDTSDWNNGTVVVPHSVVIGDMQASGLEAGDSSRVRYSFLIHSGIQSAFGIVTDKYDVKDGYLTQHGWGLSQHDGKVQDRGSKTRKHATPFVKAGTIVDVEVDVKQRSLRFYVNNQGYGVAYSNLPAGLRVHGAVSLYNANCVVTIMSRPLRSKLHKLGDDLLLGPDEMVPDAIRITKTVSKPCC